MARAKRQSRTGSTFQAFLAAECANWRKGGCIGADLAGTFAMALPFCLVRAGARCAYAERCLLPVARSREEAQCLSAYTRVVARDREAVEALDDQTAREVRRHPFRRQLAPARAPEGERSCQCGRPLPKRRRLCEKCRLERRRATKRQAQRRWRQTAGSGVDS